MEKKYSTMDKKIKMSLISHKFGNNTCHNIIYRFGYNVLKTAFFIMFTDTDPGQMHFFAVLVLFLVIFVVQNKLRANVCAYEIT